MKDVSSLESFYRRVLEKRLQKGYNSDILSFYLAGVGEAAEQMEGFVGKDLVSVRDEIKFDLGQHERVLAETEPKFSDSGTVWPGVNYIQMGFRRFILNANRNKWNTANPEMVDVYFKFYLEGFSQIIATLKRTCDCALFPYIFRALVA